MFLSTVCGVKIPAGTLSPLDELRYIVTWFNVQNVYMRFADELIADNFGSWLVAFSFVVVKRSRWTLFDTNRFQIAVPKASDRITIVGTEHSQIRFVEDSAINAAFPTR